MKSSLDNLILQSEVSPLDVEPMIKQSNMAVRFALADETGSKR